MEAARLIKSKNLHSIVEVMVQRPGVPAATQSLAAATT